MHGHCTESQVSAEVLRSRDENHRRYRMEFHPAVLHVDNIGPGRRNSFPDEVAGKNSLAETIAHAFGDRVVLRHRPAADWLHYKITGLLVYICLVQERPVFRVEVELDVPIAILFGSRFHNDSGDGQTRIDDLQAIFGARELP
jgi:hypothetical protein